jgi:hypothetical protein
MSEAVMVSGSGRTLPVISFGMYPETPPSVFRSTLPMADLRAPDQGAALAFEAALPGLPAPATEGGPSNVFGAGAPSGGGHLASFGFPGAGAGAGAAVSSFPADLPVDLPVPASIPEPPRHASQTPSASLQHLQVALADLQLSVGELRAGLQVAMTAIGRLEAQVGEATAWTTWGDNQAGAAAQRSGLVPEPMEFPLDLNTVFDTAPGDGFPGVAELEDVDPFGGVGEHKSGPLAPPELTVLDPVPAAPAAPPAKDAGAALAVQEYGDMTEKDLQRLDVAQLTKALGLFAVEYAPPKRVAASTLAKLLAAAR